MSKTVKLLSTKGRAQLIETFYFYDGEAPIKAGVVEIPVDRPEWVQRAYIMGYRLDPDTEAVLTLDEALAGNVKSTAPTQEVESTESAGEDKSESPIGGGQPDSPNGVREGKSEGNPSLPATWLGSSLSDGSQDGSGDDLPTD